VPPWPATAYGRRRPARGKHAVHAAGMYGILRGWLIGPGAGITAGFLLALAAKAAGAALLA
jgi:hypothetical protein